MIILGVNYYFHDTSVCIIKDGELLVALEEERFSREKHTWRFPRLSAKKCLALTGFSASDIDAVAFSINPTKDIGKKCLYALGLGTHMLPFVKHELWGGITNQRELRAWANNFFGNHKPEMHFIDHHLAHVMGSYYVSPYKDAALLSIDGAGEWSTTWLGCVEQGNLQCFSESFFPHSLGSFYETATQFCGFRPNYDEGKTMGLAPFGDSDVFYDKMQKLVTVDEHGKLQVDLRYFKYQNAGHQRFSEEYTAAFGEARHSDCIEARHENVAAAAQRVLEDRVLEMCKVLEQRCTADYLVVAGGVALNSVVNGRILRETRFKDLYVMPAAGDNGTAIGAAYYLHNHIYKNPNRFHHINPFVGTEYSDGEIEECLRACKLSYKRSSNIAKDVAERLFQGEIVAWFQGRMEIGPRSLGSRSILADPTKADMKNKINAQVKHREAYRPFAPSAIAERASQYFELDVEAPFMLKVCMVREAYKEKLPAITHVDGSARLQTVSADTNPVYHQMISHFGQLSGIPVVLNTSFNIMGEPVVESPIQAIRCFFSTGLDVLAIGNFIVEK